MIQWLGLCFYCRAQNKITYRFVAFYPQEERRNHGESLLSRDCGRRKDSGDHGECRPCHQCDDGSALPFLIVHVPLTVGLRVVMLSLVPSLNYQADKFILLGKLKSVL